LVQSDSNFLHHFVVGAAAASAFELLKLYELKHKLTNKKTTRLLHSGLFWITVAGMIAASGFFAWVFYAERPHATAAELALCGVAARSLVREAVAALSVKQGVKLGDDGQEALSLRDLFL